MALLEAMTGSPDRARRLGWLAYGAQAAGLALYVITLWLQVYLDTRRMQEVARDRCSESHRCWRLRTALVFLLWTILGGLAIPLGIGWIVLIAAYLWTTWRLAKGMLYYRRRQAIGTRRRRAGGQARPGIEMDAVRGP